MRSIRLLSRAFVALVPCLLYGLGVASAQEPRGGVAVKVTTLGFAFEGAVPVTEKTNLRGGFDYYRFSGDTDTDGITLNAKLKLRSLNLYYDWYPSAGSFHVSPGVMLYNGIRAEATARVPTGETFDLGDQKDLVSDPTDPVAGNAAISFGKVAPLVVLGWGNVVPRGDRRWSIPIELGIVYARAPKATLNLTGRACAIGLRNCRSIATDPQLQADLKKQEASFNDDLNPLQILPVISIGFAYRF